MVTITLTPVVVGWILFGLGAIFGSIITYILKKAEQPHDDS
jgi:hypothetical protein